MLIAKPRLVAAAIAVAVLAAGGLAFIAFNKPSSTTEAAGPSRGPGGPPGRGPGGRQGGGPPTQVSAIPATPYEFSARIEDLGTLEPRERVVLTANAADRVTGVFFEDGQRVAKGKTLVTLVNEEEVAQLASSQATYDNARQVYERNQRLATNDAIAQLELERSKSSSEAAQANVAAIQARLRDRVIVAPFRRRARLPAGFDRRLCLAGPARRDPDRRQPDAPRIRGALDLRQRRCASACRSRRPRGTFPAVPSPAR